jgi:hypothetical protein
MTGAALTPAFTDKLVKVLAMLGSVHDGEVASAGGLTPCSGLRG